MEIYKKEYSIGLVDVFKRRFVSKILHYYIKLYKKQYPNLAIFARDHVGIRVQVDGLYEKPYLEFFIDWLKHNKFNFSAKALDVGANIGNHSVFFSKYFDQVLSFEPNPSTYHLLSYNATLGGNIAAHNVGVSEKSIEAKMSTMDGNAGGAFVDLKGTIPIKLVNLDNYLEDSKDINLIKIDVEGHELNALKGMKRIIFDNKPLIVFEQHMRDFENGKSEVIEYLKGLGYTKFAYVEDGVVQPNKLYTLIKIFSKILGKVNRKMIVDENIKPGFYIFLIAVHQENENLFLDNK